MTAVLRLPPVALPQDDALLTFAAVAERLGIHPKNVGPYIARFASLTAAVRIVKVSSTSLRGTPRLLRSVLVWHQHVELRDGEPDAVGEGSPS